MGKARKLKSGNWNIQVYDGRDENGRIRLTSFTAPTKAEVEFKAAQYKKDHPKRTPGQDMTVGAAVDRYISLCGTLSPSTTTSYRSMRRNAFQSLMDTPVKRLTPEIVQKAINQESRRVSAKTVKNGWGLISAALRSVCDTEFNITLPKAKRQLKQYPDPTKVVDVIMKSDIKLPCLLSIWCTFSMSEILGIKCSDIKDGLIYINRVRISTADGLVEKSIAKTATRNRVQRIPVPLMELIQQEPSYKEYLEHGTDGYLITTPKFTIRNKWRRICQQNNLDLTFHDLRHMSASIMLMLGVPEKYAQERGGWSTPHVMKTVYQHTFSQERIAVDGRIDEYMSDIIKNV